jgi:hypothetical protein
MAHILKKSAVLEIFAPFYGKIILDITKGKV